MNLEEPVMSASVLSSLMTPRHWPTSSKDKLSREGEMSLNVECKKVYLCKNLKEPVTFCLPVSYLP